MASPAFERFLFSFFEDTDSARQGLDMAALAELAGAERTSAETMLLDYLPDTRAIIGLGLLGSKRADPELVRLFEAEHYAQQASKLAPDSYWWPYQLIALGKALWEICPNPRWLASVIDVLSSEEDPALRQAAAQALAGVRELKVVHALSEALDDPENLVRYHAARGLLAIYGLQPPKINETEHMVFRIMSNSAARRESGKLDVLSTIARSAFRPM